MVGFLIRDALPADMDVLRDLYRRSSLSNEGDRATLWAHPGVLVFADVSVREQRTRVAVASDGRVLGFATTLVTGAVAELEDLFVDPDWMRRGIGSDLVVDVARPARARGVTRIEVTGNKHASAFYDSAGFVLDGEAQTQFGPAHRMYLEVVP